MAAQEVDIHRFTTPLGLTPTIHRDPYPAIAPELESNSQKGKIIIITGGGTGIGKAAAKVWARAGAAGIVITGRRISILEDASKEINTVNPDTIVLPIQADITSEDDAKSLYAQVQQKFGRPADVLLNNAGIVDARSPVGEKSVTTWWESFEINLKGLYIMIRYYILAQPNPKEPVGTIIVVSSGRASLTLAGGSDYDISKLAGQKLVEHVQTEYPTLRLFTTMPGITKTDMVGENSMFAPYAHDHVDLTGMQALYLAQPRADYLKGSMVSVNWDVLEMEKHKEDILEKKLLWTSWLPILPVAGGKGLSTLV